MREETRRKLDRALRLQRLRRIGVVLAAAAMAAGGLLLVDLAAAVEDHRLPGTIERVSLPAVRNAARGFDVGVALDDGRHVRVLALGEHDLHAGDRVAVTEHRHRTGRVTFTWR